MAFILSFYERNQAYGGPEEGGWYFDTFELVRSFCAYPTREKASKAASRANALLNRLQRRKRPVSSVAYSGGRHVAMVHENIPPIYLPEFHPHYE